MMFLDVPFGEYSFAIGEWSSHTSKNNTPKPQDPRKPPNYTHPSVHGFIHLRKNHWRRELVSTDSECTARNQLEQSRATKGTLYNDTSHWSILRLTTAPLSLLQVVEAIGEAQGCSLSVSGTSYFEKECNCGHLTADTTTTTKSTSTLGSSWR